MKYSTQYATHAKSCKAQSQFLPSIRHLTVLCTNG